ncbi:hypothetical protein LCGC14_2445440, partial [marine sediment metagenome]
MKNSEEYFKVFDIFAYKEDNIQKNYKLSGTYDFVEQPTPQYPTINYGTTTLGNPRDAHDTDLNYWDISSENNKVEIDFLFDNLGDISNLGKLDIVLEATSFEIDLETNTDFSYFNYQVGNFQQLTVDEVDGNKFTITLPNTEFSTLFEPQTSLNKILLKILVTDTNSFVLSIDSLAIKGLEEWSLNHDLYKASFKFKPTFTTGGVARFFVKEGVSIDLNLATPQYNSGQEYTVSFYYDTTPQTWYVYIDQNLDHTVFDPSPIDLSPRVETHFPLETEGIEVIEMNSIYYKKIKTEADFEDYKTLVSAYHVGLFTDGVFLDNIDAFLT